MYTYLLLGAFLLNDPNRSVLLLARHESIGSAKWWQFLDVSMTFFVQPESGNNVWEKCTESYTVHKMGLILYSTEQMLKMQFSMARKFTLQPLCRNGVNPPKKNWTNIILRLTCHAWRKVNNTCWAQTFDLRIPSLILYQHATLTLVLGVKIKKPCTYFLSNFTTSLIFCIIKSKAKIFKFNVNLLLIKCDDFLCTYFDNFTFYTEHAGEE
jgi:hypothetical protein